MVTLTEFLLARTAEDEAKAQAAVTCNGAAWTASDLHHSGWRISGTTNIGNPHSYGDEMDSLWDDEGAMGMWPETAAHVVAHDPARVLAGCEAKRRIVAMDFERYGEQWAVLSALALPYADHPDYREEWRP